MSDPLAALANPARFLTSPPQGVVPNSFVGIPERQATNPVSGLNIDVDYLDAGTTTPGKMTNGSYKHGFPQNKREWATFHTGGRMAIFISKDSGMDCGKQTHRMHSISHMNYMLRHNVEFRNRYNQPDTNLFLSDWAFAGFQQGQDVTHSQPEAQATKQSIFVMKRARVLNYWAAVGESNRPLRKLDSLYFIIIRMKENKKPDGAQSHWFWQIVPYWESGKLSRPKSCLYMSPPEAALKDRWIGYVIRVGTCFDVYYPTQWNQTIFQQAKDGLFPTNERTYAELIYKLPDIDIDLMV